MPSSARQHFEQTGKLTRCPNPTHFLDLGPLLIGIRWASSWTWSTLSDRGDLHSHWFSIGTVESQSGMKAIALRVSKLYLMAGIVRRPKKQS